MRDLPPGRRDDAPAAAALTEMTERIWAPLLALSPFTLHAAVLMAAPGPACGARVHKVGPVRIAFCAGTPAAPLQEICINFRVGDAPLAWGVLVSILTQADAQDPGWAVWVGGQPTGLGAHGLELQGRVRDSDWAALLRLLDRPVATHVQVRIVLSASSAGASAFKVHRTTCRFLDDDLHDDGHWYGVEARRWERVAAGLEPEAAAACGAW